MQINVIHNFQTPKNHINAFHGVRNASPDLVRLAPGGPEPKIVDEQLFATVVRAAFGQRRKKLSNALKSLEAGELLEELGLADLWAGEVTVANYVKIVRKLSP